MVYKSHVPSGQFGQYVERIFYFRDLKPEHTKERVVPNGHIYLIFELDGMVRRTYDNESLQPNGTFNKAWLAGMQKNYLTISAHPHSEMVVIQFKPYGAFPFIQKPIYSLNDKVCPGQEIFGDRIIYLRDQLTANTSVEARFNLVDQWLEERFDHTKVPPEELVKILKSLMNRPASLYREILNTFPNSRKHLISQFKKYVGLTPKYFQRIMRFNDILNVLNEKKMISWTQITYESGFSDQSHFIREFRFFSGFNPQKYIKEDFQKDEPNFFPLDHKG